MTSYWRTVRDAYTMRDVGVLFRRLFFCIAIAALSIAPFLMDWRAYRTPVADLTLQLLGSEILWGLGLTCGWIGLSRWAFTDNEPWYDQWAVCGFAALAALAAVAYAVS